MNDQLAEKFADLFAKCAATGDTAELRKEAAAHDLVKEALNPLLSAGLGAAGGAGVGYLTANKKKNKLRNALYGALTGGLAGGGGALAWNSWNGSPADGLPADKPSPDTSVTRGADGKLTSPKIEYDNSSHNPDSPISKVRGYTTAAGALGGATLAGRAMDHSDAGKRLFGGRSGYGGELDRLAQTQNGKSKPYTAVQQFLDSVRRGDIKAPAAFSPTPAPTKPELKLAPPRRSNFGPGVTGQMEFSHAVQQYRDRKPVEQLIHDSKLKAWLRDSIAHHAEVARTLDDHARSVLEHNAKVEMGRTGSLGETPAARDQNLRILSKELGNKPILSTDLNNAKGWRPHPLYEPFQGKFQRGRAAVRGAGGILGGVGAELLVRALQNSIAGATSTATKK